MRILSLILGLFLLVGCFPEEEKAHVHIDSRDSLLIFFPEHPELENKLEDTDLFLLYVRSMEYSFGQIRDGDVVEWTGPDGRMSGRLSLLKSVTLDGEDCRTFYHQMKLDGVSYNGGGEVCSDSAHNQWLAKPQKQ